MIPAHTTLSERSKTCRDMYLDWVNNFLTVNKFAEHYRISERKAKQIIRDGRINNNLR